MDDVTLPSDVKPEMKNDRVMVPLRIISENLGATVVWADREVTLTKSDMTIKLKPNSNLVIKNDEPVELDATPYISNDRMLVPLRFIAESFDCTVDYRSSTVSIYSKPLVIDNKVVRAMQEEYHMVMGGVITHFYGNAYLHAIYAALEENKGEKTAEPERYFWITLHDIPGTYSKAAQYDFLDGEGNNVKRYDMYTIITWTFPKEELEGYHEVLLHDVSEDEWYLFTESARQSILQLLYTAISNGFSKIISNTAV